MICGEGGSLARLSTISSLELVVRRGWSPLLGKLSVVERLLGNASCDDEGAKSSKPPASKLDMFFWAGFRLGEAALSTRCLSSAQIASGPSWAGGEARGAFAFDPRRLGCA